MYSMLNRTCTGQRRRSSRRRRPCSNASATSITLSGDGSRTGRIVSALPTFRSTTYSRHHILHARVPDAYYQRMQSLSRQSRRRMHESKRGVTLTLTWSVIFVGGVVWRTSRGASMRWSSGGVGDTLGSGVARRFGVEIRGEAGFRSALSWSHLLSCASCAAGGAAATFGSATS